MLKQPLTISLNEEDDEVCLQLFYTLLLHAGKIILLGVTVKGMRYYL